jgi:methionine synthase II (cobalamin-independent)
LKIAFLPLLIGSLPHTNPEEGVEAVFHFLPNSPNWPQFPKISQLEGMEFQYLENIPGWCSDSGKIIFYKSENALNLISQYLEFALKDSYDRFSITEKNAVGLSIFLEKLKNRNPEYLKGQVIGPITFLTSHKLEDGTRLYKDDLYVETIPLFLRQKALYQYYEFKKVSPNSEVIIFFDEPILSEIGSAVTNISVESAGKTLNRTLDNLPFISGIHICGNSDWDFILRLPVDIVNFDAYKYLDEFLLYKKAIKDFITEGKSIALGIIPTNKDDISLIDENTLLTKTIGAIESLKSITAIKDISKKIIITPSCGMGTLDLKDSLKVLTLIRSITENLRKIF